MLRQFPELQECQHSRFLSLYAYCSQRPEWYFSRDEFRVYLNWLRAQHASDSPALAAYLLDNAAELDRSLLFLAEINRYGWHDSVPPRADEYEVLRFIDQVIHPTYLRLAEAVLLPLARLPAFFIRAKRGKHTEGLDLYNVAEELQRAGLASFTAAYRQGVRNAIAHGGIVYRQREVVYHDRSGSSTLTDRAMVALLDDLLDACNGMALALRVFLLTSDGTYPVPLQVLLAEVRAQTESPWWHIEGCVPSELPDGRKQLNLYARPRTGDGAKVRYTVTAAAALAAQLAPAFDRYFFSLHGEKALPGWAAFDGARLVSSISRGERPVESAARSLEDGIVFYVPRVRLPQLLGKAETMAHSLRLHWPLAMAGLRSQRRLPHIEVRSFELHRQGLRSVLHASVVITSEGGAIDQQLVRDSCRAVMRAASRAARRAMPMLRLTRYLPVGWARVAVFRRDYRRRVLESFGLRPDLVCTVGVKRIARIRAPDISGATLERFGRYHIAWNAAWLAGRREAT